VLAGLVDRRLALRARWKGRRLKATLRRDGYVSFRGRKYDSPSAAARKAVGHAMMGGCSGITVSHPESGCRLATFDANQPRVISQAGKPIRIGSRTPRKSERDVEGS
jgi:hypothetical protein